MSEDLFQRLSQQIAELRDDVRTSLRAGERIERAREEVDRGAAAHEAEPSPALAEQMAIMQQQIRDLDARVAALERKKKG